MRFLVRAELAAALIVVVSAVGCGGEEFSEVTEDKVPPSELDRVEDQILEHENLISVCMADHGFEYVAELPPDWYAHRALSEAEAAGHPDPHSVQVEALNAAAAKGLSNDAYLGSLSEADREAYDRVLWGSSDGSVVGCNDATYDEAWNADPNRIVLDIDTFDEIVSESEELAVALADFEACMADHGYIVSGMYDIHEQFFDLYEEMGLGGGDPDPDDKAWEKAHEEYLALYDPAMEVYGMCTDAYQEVVYEQVFQGLYERYSE